MVPGLLEAREVRGEKEKVKQAHSVSLTRCTIGRWWGCTAVREENSGQGFRGVLLFSVHAVRSRCLSESLVEDRNGSQVNFVGTESEIGTGGTAGLETRRGQNLTKTAACPIKRGGCWFRRMTTYPPNLRGGKRSITKVWSPSTWATCIGRKLGAHWEEGITTGGGFHGRETGM